MVGFPKEDASIKKKWPLVVDYRKLNDVKIGDAYPLTNIKGILDKLCHAKYFSTFNLASGFDQIAMKDKYRAKTSFSTPQEHLHLTECSLV